MMTHLERLRDEGGFIHKKIGGFIGGLPGIGGIAKEFLGGVPLIGGIAEEFFFGGTEAVPQATVCPPGFIASPTGCVPRAAVGFQGGPVTSARPRGPGNIPRHHRGVDPALLGLGHHQPGSPFSLRNGGGGCG